MQFDQLKRRDILTLLGGAAAWPLVARAQQPGGMPRIGLLSSFAENDPEAQAWIRAFMQGLQELGWINGRNVQIEFRFAAGDSARISTLATELIELRPDMLFAVGPIPAAALRAQTLSIPIVFVQVADAVGQGFVTNLARPQGNATGFTNFEFSGGGKWLQLLRQCAPDVSAVAVVFDPNTPSWPHFLCSIEVAAPTFGIRLGWRESAGAAQRQRSGQQQRACRDAVQLVRLLESKFAPGLARQSETRSGRCDH